MMNVGQMKKVLEGYEDDVEIRVKQTQSRYLGVFIGAGELEIGGDQYEFGPSLQSTEPVVFKGFEVCKVERRYLGKK